jgi:Fe-S oxidoreductase
MTGKRRARRQGEMAEPTAVGRALAVLRERLDERTAAYASACVRCGLCAESCHVFLADGQADSIPAHKAERVARLLRRHRTWLGRVAPGLVGARTLDEDALNELAMAVFGRCSQCGRCALECSVGLDPRAVIGFGRTMLSAAGMTPKGIRANVDTALTSGNNMAIARQDVLETLAWLEEDLRATVGDPTVALPVDRHGARVLYLLNPREIKFFPLSISAAGLIFHTAGEDWTLTSTDFDITNYGFFAADENAARELAGRLVRRAEELGVEEVVVAECGHGYRALRWEAPEWLGRTLPFRVRSFVEVLADYIASGRLRLDPAKNPQRVTLHDPCNLVRSGGVIEEPRVVLRHAAAEFVEMTPNREHNYCCGGGGGLLAASEYAAIRIEAGRIKAEQIRATGAKVVASPCHNCVDQLLELVRHYRLDVEIKTLAEIVADALVVGQP